MGVPLIPGPSTNTALRDKERNVLEIENAFIDRPSPPSQNEIEAALGASVPTWKQLLDWLSEQGVTEQEWKSISPKYGWSLRPKLKKRTILHLSPCKDCFGVVFILGDRAVASARKSDLLKGLRQIIDEAPHYPEGTGIRFVVRSPRDLAPIRRLTLIKLAN